MTDVDINPFGGTECPASGEDQLRPEDIPLTLVGGRSTWEPESEQETSLGGKSLETLKYETLESFVKSLYKRLSGRND